MVKIIKKKYIGACLVMLVPVIIFIIGFEMGFEKAKDHSWEENLIVEMGIQKALLKSLYNFREQKYAEAVSIIEVELYLLTAVLADSVEGDIRQTKYYSLLRQNLVETSNYLDKYDVFDKENNSGHYEAARKSIKNFLSAKEI